MFKLPFLQKRKTQRENFQIVKKRIAQSQQAVYEAVLELNRPVTGREVARHLHWDSASVTNRLAELTKKGRIRVAYKKRGMDGIWRRYYKVK